MALSASDVWEALDQKLLAAGFKLDMELEGYDAAEQTLQALDQVHFRQPRIERIDMEDEAAVLVNGRVVCVWMDDGEVRTPHDVVRALRDALDVGSQETHITAEDIGVARGEWSWQDVEDWVATGPGPSVRTPAVS